LKIYNTLSGKKEEFAPRQDGKVSMYVCGPTVYNYIHIGNARAYIAFDAIIRYFRFKGLDVKYVRNLTDVDDKIIKRAAEEKTSTEAITAKYTDAFHKDMEALGVLPPTIEPKATETIVDMIATIEQLVQKNLAYEVDGDVYFSVEKFPGYGKLSKRSIDEMIAGARIEVDERKQNPADFALWKKAKEGEPSWSSPWGNGRPGWHIECSTMSIKYLGMGFDIHGGGQDLIFPHHENEIAQAEGATGQAPFARYWMHNGFLNIEAEKMAKSVGNVILINDLEKQYEGRLNDLRNHLRMLFLSTHYRSPLNFSEKALEEAGAKVYSIEELLGRITDELNQDPVKNALDESKKIDEFSTKFRNLFQNDMDNDFNTSRAISRIFDFRKYLNIFLDTRIDKGLSEFEKKALSNTKDTILALSNVLGFDFHNIFSVSGTAKIKLDRAMELLLEEREKARTAKDFSRADEIRKRIEDAGYIIEDTPKGPKVKKKD